MTAETAREGSLTAYVAEFAASTRFAGIPGDVLGLGKKSILDGLGLALAGSVAKSGGIIRRHLQGLKHGRFRRRPSSGRPAPSGAVRGLRQRDRRYTPTTTTTRSLPWPRTGYTGCSPTRRPRRCRRRWLWRKRAAGPGQDLLTAYHVGVEVECKIAEAINPRHYQHGFHSTATCGALGAAAGVANLVGLSD